MKKSSTVMRFAYRVATSWSRKNAGKSRNVYCCWLFEFCIILLCGWRWFLDPQASFVVSPAWCSFDCSVVVALLDFLSLFSFSVIILLWICFNKRSLRFSDLCLFSVSMKQRLLSFQDKMSSLSIQKKKFNNSKPSEAWASWVWMAPPALQQIDVK